MKTIWSEGALPLTQKPWRPFLQVALPVIYAVFMGWFGIFGSLTVSRTLSMLVVADGVQWLCLFIGMAAAVAAVGLVFLKPLLEIVGSLLLGAGLWAYVALLIISLRTIGTTPTASLAGATAFVVLVGFRIYFLARTLPRRTK